MSQYLIALLTTVVGTIAVAVRQWLKTYLTPQRITTLAGLARAVTTAAEELGRAVGLSSSEKYEYAENALRVLAKRMGLRLTPEETNALIHAVLYEGHEYEDTVRRVLADEDDLLDAA